VVTLAAVLVAAAALPPYAATPAVAVQFSPVADAAGNLTCTATHSEVTVDGTVKVPRGAKCTLVDLTVMKDVSVAPTGALVAEDSTVKGNLEADDAKSLIVQGGTLGDWVQSRGRREYPRPPRPTTCAASP
jgi:hypothetical protein